LIMHHYLEYIDEKSSKFWEITLDGAGFTVHYGRTGTNGQMQTKSFPSDDEARKEAEKLLREKLKKGYVEKDGKELPAAASAQGKSEPDPAGRKKPSTASIFTAEPFAVETKKVPPVWSALGNRFFNVCAFSPDGLTLYEAGHDTISVWDARTGVQTGYFSSEKDVHTKIIYDIAVSPDGRLIATGSEDKSLIIWDVQTGQSVKKIRFKDFVESVAFSSDGNDIYAGINDGTLKIVDSVKMKEKQSIGFEELSAVKFVKFFPDGRRYAVLGIDHSVTWKDGKSASWVYIVQSAEDHTRLLTVHAQNEDEEIRSFALSPDGKTAAIGIFSRSFRLIDAETGKEIFSPEHGGDGSVGISFAPDSNTYATISQLRLVEIWKKGVSKAVQEFKVFDFSGDVRFLKDGSLMITTMHHRTVYDAGLNPVVRYEPLALSGISAVEYGGTLIVCHSDGKIRRWNSETGELLPLNEINASGKPYFSHDGSKCIFIEGENPVITGIMTDERMEVPGSFGELTAAAFSRNGKYIAFADADCTVTILETGGFSTVSSFSVKPKDRGRRVTTLCFSTDGESVFADGFYKMTWYDCSTGKETIGGFTDTLAALAVSKKYTVTGNSEGSVSLWQTCGKDAIRDFKKYDGGIEFVALSGDEKLFYCFYKTGLVRAISTAKKNELFSFAFYADGEWLSVDNEGRFRASAGGTRHLEVSSAVDYMDFYAGNESASAETGTETVKSDMDVNLHYAILNAMKDFTFDRDEFHKRKLGPDYQEDHDCEYDTCPVIEEYLQSLDLSAYHPETVTGIDWSGGCFIQHQIWLYWDGECETFHIESLAGIGICNNLKDLNIGLSLITDLEPLTSLKHLKSLTLEQSPECDPVISLEPLLRITSLREVSLGTIMVEDADQSNEVIEQLVSRGVKVEADVQG
ncbi:MAG: WGR domain-containing protein, partial [Spirochaetes bacterium]|nr:WGR domain-containing protein [Spirochaetota bacterium]